MSLQALLIGLAAQASAEYSGPVAIPRIFEPEDCVAERKRGDIVVCGRRRESERYRVRGSESPPSSWREGRAWSAIVAEEEEQRRYGSQTVGPFGYLQFGQQQVREWRLEREQMAKARREETRQIERAVPGETP